MDKIYTFHWLELDREIRAHLAEQFKITRTGTTEIKDTTLVSDGTTNDDLARAFTKEKMSEYTGSPVETGVPQLWTITVSKAKYEVHPPILIPTPQSIAPVVAIAPEPVIVPEVVVPTPPPALPEVIELPAAKFCYHCDSGGIRHKKECTKPGVVNGFEVKFNPEEVPNA